MTPNVRCWTLSISATEATSRPCAMVVRRTDRTQVSCRAGGPLLPIVGAAIRADVPMLVRRGPRASAGVEVVVGHRALRDRLGRPVAVIHLARKGAA